MQQRPSRTTYFLEIAKLVAKRSTCHRAQVGAVLVANNRIIATGYNGSPPGARHCIDEGCLIHDGHCIRTIHAELNAILQLDGQYSNIDLYCTHQPCMNCYKALYTIKVKNIYYINDYADGARSAIITDLGFPYMCMMTKVEDEV